MKYRNYINNTYYVVFNTYLIVCFVLSTLVIILHVNKIFLIFGIIILIFTILLAFFFYYRCYYLDNKCLTIKVGFIKKKYDLNSIKKCYITEGNDLSYATSKKRLCIEFENHRIFISPEKMDEVLLYLIKKSGRKKK